jgi:septum formation protein
MRSREPQAQQGEPQAQRGEPQAQRGEPQAQRGEPQASSADEPGAPRGRELNPPLVLASASPQRRAILERLGVAFEVRPTDVAELGEGDPVEVAAENAMRKARAARRADAEEAVLGVDTLVTLEGLIYGKPADEREARATLRALSGARHRVLSGLVLLLPGGEERVEVVATAVTFRHLNDELLDWYVGVGEWRERSGGYAIQGSGSILARSVEGDVQNVVGLPLAALLDLHPELLPCK